MNSRQNSIVLLVLIEYINIWRWVTHQLFDHELLMSREPCQLWDCTAWYGVHVHKVVHVLRHFDFPTLYLLVAIHVSFEQILLEKNLHCMVSLEMHPLVSWLTFGISLAKLKDSVLEFGADISEVVFFHRISFVPLDQALDSHFFEWRAY